MLKMRIIFVFVAKFCMKICFTLLHLANKLMPYSVTVSQACDLTVEKYSILALHH